MTKKEAEEMLQRVRDSSASVGELVDYLRENFSLDDKLCRLDCVEGLRNDCVYVKKSEIGGRFFRYVRDDKRSVAAERGRKEADEMYPYVKDEDVIVA